MSLFRSPKGTYTRSTPDWFSARAASGSGYANGAHGALTAIGLFNNDSLGRPLYVFAYAVTDRFAGLEVDTTFVQGPLGALYTGAAATAGTYPIDPLLGQPPGEIWVDLTAPQVAALGGLQSGLYNQSGFIMTPGFAPGYPIAIVRPGYTFVSYNTNGGTLAGWFYYLYLDS